ncbi:MAG: hypothetical protein ACRC8S_04320 [Fimbriiglobus sp.]
MTLSLAALSGIALADPPAPPTKDGPKEATPEPINPLALNADRGFFQRIEWDAPLRGEDANWEEFEAYNETVLHARQFTSEQLFETGLKDATFRDLVNSRSGQDFQFKIVSFEGRMKRLRRIEPSAPLKKAGIKDLYECWIFPHLGADPLCLVLVDLPEGITPNLLYQQSPSVKFGAYYFKLIQYESGIPSAKNKDRNQIRRAPLMMSRGLIVTADNRPDAGKPWREGFLPGIATLVGGLFLFACLLTVWYWRGDRDWRKLREERRNQNPFPEASSSERGLDWVKYND